MIALKNVALYAGVKCLFENANITINQGYRVGVVGANGCGKSSLFQLIAGKRHSDQGDIGLSGQLRIAEVEQEISDRHLTVVDYTLQGDSERHRTQQALDEAQIRNDTAKIAALHQYLEDIDGYTAPIRAAKLLRGLGFDHDEIQRPLTSFSGGWQMRANLARALMKPSDLLLLDEPTNHLDLDAVIWLSDWLRSYRGTLLVISHDREFLDDVTDHILHIESRQMKLYTGNYSEFEIQRSALLEQQQSTFVKQQRQIAHLTKFIERFKAKASKAKQAQARVKWLERIEKVAPIYSSTPMQFHFEPVPELPDLLYSIKNTVVGYQNKPILSSVSMVIRAGDRIGLLGYNGAGKSTLIKTIAGDLPTIGGEVTIAKNLRVGYFAQHQLDQLDLDASPLLHLQRLAPLAREEELRTYIGSFGYTGDKALEAIRFFSGGEKARLALAILIFKKPHLLLLDEPTNHLDMDVRQALSLALQEFDGAIVVISHDRHFLRSNVNEFYLVGDGKVTLFDGDLNDYQNNVLSSRNKNELTKSESEQKGETDNRKDKKRQEAELRQRQYPIKKEIQKLETEIAQLQKKLTEIESLLADAEIYQDSKKTELKKALVAQTELTQTIGEKETRWLELSEQLERIN